MEKDDEVSGSGNSYTTYFRQYDPRLGRWKSLDPKMAKFPWQSPFVGMDNNPISLNDPMGDETGEPEKTASGDNLNLPSNAKVSKRFKGSKVKGKKTGRIYSVKEGSVSEFTIGDKTFSAKFGSKSGNFLYYETDDGEIWLNQIFDQIIIDGFESSSVSKNADGSWGSTLAGLGITIYGIGSEVFLSSSDYKVYKQAARDGKFVGFYKGELKIWKNRFRGNPSISGAEVKAAKETFNTKLAWMRGAKLVGNGLAITGGLISIYEYSLIENPSIEQTRVFKADISMTVIGFIPFGGWVVAGSYSLGKYLYGIPTDEEIAIKHKQFLEGKWTPIRLNPPSVIPKKDEITTGDGRKIKIRLR